MQLSTSLQLTLSSIKTTNASTYLPKRLSIRQTIALRQSGCLEQGVPHLTLVSNEGGNSESGQPAITIPINYCQKLQTNRQ